MKVYHYRYLNILLIIYLILYYFELFYRY